MIDSRYLEKGIAFAVTLLFIITSVSSIVFGFKVDAVSEVAVEVEPESTVSFAPMDSPWPMKCHDTHHSGRSPYSTIHINSTEKWRFKCGWLEDTPVIDNDGTIYIGCNDRYLYAVYPNGTLKWKYKLNGIIWGSSPALSEDGTIYVGSWDAKLYAITSNGTLKWKAGAGGSIATSPAIAEDGTIYVGTMSSGNSLVAFYPNGTRKWKYETGYSITGGPAVGHDGTIYIGSGDTYFYSIYPNGTLKWRFKTDNYIKGPPSIADDDTIYIGSWDDYLYALYTNGTMKWKCKVGQGTSTNPSIAEDGTIYVGGNYLYAIYSNGTMRWRFHLGPDGRSIHSSSPAISDDGTIYVGTNIGETSGGEIIAVNPDGTEKWRKRIADEWVESSPSIGEDGTVYIGSSSLVSGDDFGYLHAFGPVESNKPPEKPNITGKTNGDAGTKYEYTFVSNDPEDYPVKFYIEWGDNTSKGWTKEYVSGGKAKFSHKWSEKGTYTIKAKSKDISEYESEWGELKVTMPKSQNLDIWNRFPRLYRLIDLLNRV